MLYQRASSENNLNLMNKLLPHIDRDFVPPMIDSSFLMSLQVYRGLYGIIPRPTDRFFAFELDYDDEKDVQQYFIEAVIFNKWDQIHQFLETKPLSFLYRLYSLIYCKKPEAFEIVKSYYPKLDKSSQIFLLRATIQTGREEETDWMGKFVPEFFTFNDNFYPSLAEDPTWATVNRHEWLTLKDYNPLTDAYFGSNLNLIQRFKDLGYDSEKIRKPQLIVNGYKQRMSNPIDVYYLVKHELGLKNNLGWNYYRENFYEIDDVEINGLIDSCFEESLSLDLLIDNLMSEGTCHNLVFLKACVSRLPKSTLDDSEREYLHPMCKKLILDC